MTSFGLTQRLLFGTAVILTGLALAVTGPASRASAPGLAQVIPTVLSARPQAGPPTSSKSSPIRLTAPIAESVTTTADSGSGSLRDAIATANGDTANNYVITFNLTYPATITLTSGALTVTGNVDIQGPGASKLTVSGNNASQVFVFNFAGTSTISGLTISDGKAPTGQHGGAIDNLVTNLDVSQCVFQDCSGWTGGIFSNSGHLAVTGCTFLDNKSSNTGGGVEIAGESGSSLSACTFVGNSALAGGGLYIQDATSTTVANCTFVNNSAQVSSGTLYIVIAQIPADMTNNLINCTIVNGHGTGASGCGIRLGHDQGNTYLDKLTLQNTLVWADKGDFLKSGNSSFVSNGYNFDSDGTSGFVNGVNGDIVGTAGSPLNPGIGPLANNGGPVQTMALQRGSACMDAGDPNFSNSAPTVDARGATRSGPDADGNGDGTSAPDIGAYEYQRYVVVNTNDSGAGSLRDAIDHTNTYGGEVAFAIGSQGSQQVISPASPLSAILLPTFVDGWSQGGSGYKGPPLVRVDGASAGNGADGLNVGAPYTTVRGLDITEFGAGIEISGSSTHNVWIYGCYVGVALDGTSAAGNKQLGVWEVPGPSQVLIGTNADGVDDAAERNVIAANGIGTGFENVLLRGSSTTVAGNYIGLGADGTTALGDGTGVTVLTPGNLIGGTAPGAGNVISGNHNEGVGIQADHTTVQGNLIGTTADGLSPLGNGGGGVVIYSAADTDTLVGGSSPSARNVICANNGDGVSLYNGASKETIEGNYIGVGKDGATPMGNHYQGVYVTGPDNTISGNVLSGNGDSGVTLTSAGGTGNVVSGNLIGVDATGLTDVGNAGPGVRIAGGANHNQIGTDSGAANSDDRNVIACNNRDGGSIYYNNANVLLQDSGTDYNTISGNLIGLDKTGTATFSPNGGPRGVLLYSGPSNNIVGGTTAYTRNVISGNQHTGIEIVGSGTNGNAVVGNYLGTDSTGTKAIGNNYGIQTYYTGNAGNRIGGTAMGEGNLISGNRYNGINLVDNATQGTLVEGNLIGTAADGAAPLGNTDNGVDISGASGCTVGGLDAVADANVIANNGQAGIVLMSGTGDAFEGNSIHDNGGLGIDLGGNGVTPNDAGDADTGPNNYQNYPVLSVTATTIDGTLNSLPNEHYRIEFFTSPSPDPSGYGEGAIFLGATPVTTDASGNASFSYPYPSGTPAPAITATATNLSTGDTSEFSAACGAITISPPTLPDAKEGKSYSQQLDASMAVPGASGFAFAVATGALPPGLSLSPSGQISGTPTGVGSYSFTVVAAEIADGQDACTGSRSYTLVVPALAVTAQAIPMAVTTGDTVHFACFPTGGSGGYVYAWTFGDGGLSVLQNPDHVYAKAGTYTAYVTVTDSYGTMLMSNELVIQVYDPLTVTLSASPTEGAPPLAVTFTPQAAGGDGSYTYAYDYGDGTKGSAPAHTYAKAGTYNATVTVTDTASHTATSQPVTVTVGAAPAVSIGAGAIMGTAPLSVSFTSHVTGGTAPYSYAWTFGDGTTGDTADPTTVFTSAGTYTVSLTVTDGASQTTTSNAVTVTVYAPLAVQVSATPNPVIVGNPVTLGASATGGSGNYSYSWDLGDGNTGTGASLTHTYSATGTFDAKVTVTDTALPAATATATISVSVQPVPPAITGSKKQPNPFRIVLFGTNFQPGCTATIDGTAVEVKVKNSGKIKLKHCKSLCPKGVPVTIVITNPDGGVSAPYQFTR